MEELKKAFDSLKEIVADCEADFLKFADKTNKAAGVRARKALQEVKKQAQAVRVQLNELIKTVKK
jgi:hypothetical protein